MPIIKSAKKRVSISRKAATRNSKVKRTLKDAIKEFEASLKLKDKKKVTESYRKVQSALDQAGKKNILHKNKIARKKSQLSKQGKGFLDPSKKISSKKDASTKKTSVKSATKKPPAKAKSAKKPAKK